MTYQRGSKGEMVRQIQRALCSAGFGVIIDGFFGQITEEAVKAFQSTNALKCDGIVGPATLAKLMVARGQEAVKHKRSKRKIKEIIVHCSATPEGEDYTVADIRRWHKQQGWSDIGYHYVVYRDGSIHNGRDVDIIGAHCSKGGHNTYSIGVCYIGGVTNDGSKKKKDTRTSEQRDALIILLTDLRRLYPDARIYGHNDFDKGKDCPSFDAKTEYRNI